MDKNRGFRRCIRVTFVSAYLVVLAGSIVRMTGSGMGCPDWPKCFGLSIPPTNIKEVTWIPRSEYNKGQMLVADDTLWVCQENHISGRFDFASERRNLPMLWQPYEKHDYATFNPLHTWVEFVNRLIGAFTGLPALLLLGWAALRGFLGKGWRPAGMATGVVFMLGFVAWLGKKVVDGNLIPGSITIHMLGAIVILVLLAGMLTLLEVRPWGVVLDRHIGRETGFKKRLRLWGGLLFLMSLGQILFGTQVREAVDSLAHMGLARSEWMNHMPGWWKGHGFAAYVIALVHLPAIIRLRGMWWGRLVVLALAGQFLTGIALHQFGMPALAQPIHLVLALAVILSDGILWFSAFRNPLSAEAE